MLSFVLRRKMLWLSDYFRLSDNHRRIHVLVVRFFRVIGQPPPHSCPRCPILSDYRTTQQPKPPRLKPDMKNTIKHPETSSKYAKKQGYPHRNNALFFSIYYPSKLNTSCRVGMDCMPPGRVVTNAATRLANVPISRISSKLLSSQSALPAI